MTQQSTAHNWAADVKKYANNVDETAVAGIVRYCGIALQHKDSSLVAFSDKKEVERVRDHFLKHKLGLTDADQELDKAIMEVGEKMKTGHGKNRVTAYYLLADHFGKLPTFH
ncbi:MAG TPA: DUF2853 family protein [Rhizomicrobium sp.]|nr:DUF2853 family protein [Rhizomicrobium sp.]